MAKMKAYQHFRVILTHKRWVGHFCFKMGLYKQGILHDMSKFSPTEFLESAKYFTGTRSPIDLCKDFNGYSMCWLHHRGRNKHHWEYWVDNFEKGMTPIEIPKKYVIEMFCDFLGAGIAYSGGLDKFSIDSELEWWYNKRKVVIMHDKTKAQLDKMFENLSELDNVKEANKNNILKGVEF
jgi:hypothetical protein